jgi:hypothetical protein
MASYIISLNSSTYADNDAAIAGITGAGASVTKTFNLPLTFRIEATAEQLAAISGVSFSDTDDTMLTASHAGATYTTTHLTALGRESSTITQGVSNALAWSPSQNGSGTTVYLLDTGVQSSHVEFANATITNLHNASSAVGFVDTDGHGTAIGSLIVGENIGTSPNATLKNVKLFNNSNGSITVGEVVDALDAILDDHNSNTPSTAKTVCMPFTVTKNQLIDQKLNELQENNLILVAAAGNQGSEVDDYSPGGLDTIITVGAVNSDLSATSWTNLPLSTDTSNTNSIIKGHSSFAKLDIWAPGVDISVSDSANNSNYINVTGTSASAGIVAGVSTHYIQKYPSKNAFEVKSTLITEGHLHTIASNVSCLTFGHLDYVSGGKKPDWANINYSLAVAPQTTDTEFTNLPSGRILNVQYGQTANVSVGVNASATDVIVLPFSPLSPWMTFDTATGLLTADTSNATLAPASIKPGIYNFAVKGTLAGTTAVEEFSVGVYETSEDELEGAPEYYYDTDSNEYEAVITYGSAYWQSLTQKP